LPERRGVGKDTKASIMLIAEFRWYKVNGVYGKFNL